MGNSEVGHLNLGAGRDRRAGPRARRRRRRRRLAGRQPGAPRRPSTRRAPGAACCTWPASSPTAGCTRTSTTCARSWRAALGGGVPRVAVHAFTDGRDVSPHQAAGLLAALERSGPAPAPRSRPSSAATTPWIAITAVERTELARAALVDGVGGARRARPAAVEASYARGLTDEFVEPIVLGDAGLRVAQGDPLVFFDFRPDRARQICRALLPTLGLLVTMTRYDDTLGAARRVRRRAARAARSRTRSRPPGCASCTSPRPRSTRTSRTSSTAAASSGTPGEDWELVASRRDVATYDHAPEMAAAGVADALRRALRRRLRVRRRQLREPRHGRPHRRAPGGDRRRRGLGRRARRDRRGRGARPAASRS